MNKLEKTFVKVNILQHNLRLKISGITLLIQTFLNGCRCLKFKFIVIEWSVLSIGRVYRYWYDEPTVQTIFSAVSQFFWPYFFFFFFYWKESVFLFRCKVKGFNENSWKFFLGKMSTRSMQFVDILKLSSESKDYYATFSTIWPNFYFLGYTFPSPKGSRNIIYTHFK